MKDREACQCSGADAKGGCDAMVEPDGRFYATPCGTFCDYCGAEHKEQCAVCKHEDL